MEDELTNYTKYKSKTLIFNLFLFNTNCNIKKSKKKYGLLNINHYNIKKVFFINTFNFDLQYNTIYNITKENLFYNKKLDYKICVLKNYKNVCFIGIIIQNILKLNIIFDNTFIKKYLALNYKKTLFFNIKNCFYKSKNFNLIKGILLCNLNKLYFTEKVNIKKEFTLSLFEIFKKIKPYYWIIK